ncbi:type IV toxin-antitoxin system AbiEi family antitoxin domain-containing protein [Phytoactinopolyspora halotolerans]|uniref:Type IV toxin-antitoxin system AbiEi family antitoxin domain-containing protein n=1 Tax=Phytoactinopolyspora halotolerans TaxID=1981512 RepID=A0A6L9SDE7_9ACTN|nr:type IV toxin-antitoxin system AbiEi family antitoxin domain-containing protein [Phytoactinopolyspora halotolerans]NEE03286.1 type IV toxin-antitoxin system AbiEi family antitoxin domain-containing protein [Phytoactinopolyspora halotolerans]
MPPTLLRMPPDVAELLRRDGGVIVATRAQAAGIGRSRVGRLVDAGLLTRIGAGQYVSTERYTAADAKERHRLEARAFGLSRGPDVHLTGWSGAVLWELPVIGRPPDLPEAVRPRHSGRSKDVRIANLPAWHMTALNNVAVMSPAWVVADLARTRPISHALVTADAVARMRIDLQDPIGHMRGWLRVERARWIARYADPLAESPIETLGRFTVIEFGLPMPVLNAWVGDGKPEFRVDGLWPFHWAAYEADGALKYDNRPDASAIVAKQSEREWRLRQMGLDLVRYQWRLAFNGRAELAERFRKLLKDGPAPQKPIRWWKHVPGRGPMEPTAADWPSPAPTSVILPAGWDV